MVRTAPTTVSKAATRHQWNRAVQAMSFQIVIHIVHCSAICSVLFQLFFCADQAFPQSDVASTQCSTVFCSVCLIVSVDDSGLLVHMYGEAPVDTASAQCRICCFVARLISPSDGDSSFARLN